jgi:broad specificity phosphatase PhoE
VTTTILLARHGQTDWNRDGRFQGHADPPLNERGREQARVLAASLAGEGIAAIYSSDLRRASETAEIVARALGTTYEARRDLREIDVGEWSGLTIEEIEERFPEGLRRHRAPGDGWERGETHAAMSERVLGAVREIAATHPGSSILIVGHGGTIRALRAEAEGVTLAEYRRASPPLRNAEVIRIAVEQGIFRPLD